MAGPTQSQDPRREGGPPPRPWWRADLAASLALLVLVAGLLGSAAAWAVARRDAEAVLRRSFEGRSALAETRLRNRMLAYEQMLRGVTGLFAASESVERGEFSDYVAALRVQERYPGVQGIGFIQRVRPEALPAFVHGAQQDGLPGYRVWPEGARAEYAPVIFLEPPSASNAQAYGYDVGSEPVRRAGLERSRDSGQPALSGKVVLVVNPAGDSTPGALLFMPVYRNGAPTGTAAERSDALFGWTYASFRLGDLMAAIFQDLGNELAFEVFDGDSTAAADRMFDSAAVGQGATGQAGAPLAAHRHVRVADHTWTLLVRGGPALVQAAELGRPALVGLIGVALTAVLTLLVWLLADGRARALQASRQLALDLEERRRATAELEGARRFAQATLDAVPDEICVLDEAGIIVSVNRAWQAFAEANGGQPGQVSEGRPYLAACRATGSPDTDGTAFAAQLERVLAGQHPGFSHEYPCHSPGRQRWFVARVSRFEDRGRAQVLVAHQDVSELKAAEQALRVGEERLRLALTSSRTVWWDHDVPRDVVTVGEGWRALTGVDPASIHDLASWLAAIHPDDVATSLGQRQAVLEGRLDRFEDERRLRTAAGQWTWARVRGEVTGRDEGGRPLRVVGTVADIDELHALQERLLAATRLASVGTLAAGVAHEINNPLAWIHANLELAVERLDAAAPEAWAAVAAEVRVLLRESIQGTSRIAEIVKAMRSLGRPERAEEARPLDVGEELQHAVQMVRNQLQQRARLVIDVAPGLPPVQARTSELGRVFLNLLLNAVQAVPEGRPEEHLISVAARSGAGELVVEVRDSGAGISPEVMRRLFDPFFTTKPVGQGTGLGLAIARSIVVAAGGRIEVESEPGRGAAFRVHLPAAATASALAGPGAPVPPAPRPQARPRRRVLLVDDELAVASAVGRSLGRSHDVTVLGSAEEALRRLDAGERWEAMLVDLMMPGTDGIALHQRLGASHPELLARLAFLSGGAFGERATSFLADHEVVLVAKPARRDELLEVIERLAGAPPPGGRSP